MSVKRRIPIDWNAIAQESGIRRGTLCNSPAWGWCVQNRDCAGPDIGVITPPETSDSEILRVSGDYWEVCESKGESDDGTVRTG